MNEHHSEHTYTYYSKYAPGDKVIVGDDIIGHVLTVKFTYGRADPMYKVEWFHGGGVYSNEFYAFQLRPVSIGNGK